MTRDWDARTYDRVADPMTRWGMGTLARLPLAGDERVMDAGCGTGRVTEQLAERLPRGRVVALDGSPAPASAHTAAVGRVTAAARSSTARRPRTVASTPCTAGCTPGASPPARLPASDHSKRQFVPPTSRPRKVTRRT